MIIRTNRYIKELQNILNFISQDSIFQAKKFKNELDLKIDNIPNYPLIYRKSFLYDDENVRNLIFKGYVIPYLIDDDNILILGIYKNNLWKP